MAKPVTADERRALASLQAGIFSAVTFMVASFAAAIVFSAYPAEAQAPQADSQTETVGEVRP